MNRKRTAVFVALGLVLAAWLHQRLLLRENPLHAVYAQASAMGIDSEQMELVGGGYESDFLGLSAYATFRLEGDSPDTVRRLEVQRQLYFSDWRLAHYRVE